MIRWCVGGAVNVLILRRILCGNGLSARDEEIACVLSVFAWDRETGVSVMTQGDCE